MKFSRIQIKNFRCVEKIGVFPRDYTSLIGPNNSGKSAVLRAVEVLFNQETPELDEWRKGHEAEPIEIEADFDCIEDWERNKPGISSLVYNNKIQLRMMVHGVDESAGRKKPELIFESYRPEETIEGWAQSAKDKPFRAWKRVKELCENKTNLDHAPSLQKIVQFAFSPF